MRDAPDDPDTKTRWAELRTDWAEDRTVLANERTFAGWIRTGLATVVVALALHVVFGNFEPLWAAKLVASAFIGAGIVVYWAAWWTASQAVRRMNDHAVEPQSARRMTILTTLLTICSVATGLILWML